MLFVRQATFIGRSLFCQHPYRVLSFSSTRQPLRCSSSLPEKIDDEKTELVIPKKNWDPVPQKFLRLLPVEHHGVAPANFNDRTIWYPLYKFPYMTSVLAFVRFKVYVTFISMVTCIYKVSDFLLGFESGIGLTAGLAAMSLFGMTVAGNLCRKLVVQIYTTEDAEFVRLSRFTFFGKRRDIVLPKDLLIPLTDTNPTHRKLILELQVKMPPVDTIDLTYDNYEFYEENYNIILMFGGIHNEEMFEAVLGKLLRRIA